MNKDEQMNVSSRGSIERLVLLLTTVGDVAHRYSRSHELANKLRTQLRHEIGDVKDNELAAFMLDPNIEIRNLAKEEWTRRQTIKNRDNFSEGQK